MTRNEFKYYVLTKKIISKINSQEFEKGCHLPSERDFMEMYSMSRTTVRKAINDLVNEGYLYKIYGKGTFVKSNDKDDNLFSFASGTEAITKRGMKVLKKVISTSVEKADNLTIELLQMEKGSDMFKIERVFYADSVQIYYISTCLSSSLFPGIEDYDYETESLYSVLENFYGVKITHYKRTLEAILANEIIAELLGCKKGEPLILSHFFTHGLMEDQDIPIEVVKCYYRTDIHKFYIDLVRG